MSIMTKNNTDTNKIVRDFIANIIDVYETEAIDLFLTNGTINVDTLLGHHLTKLTILYNVVYNHLFGTWATKKDVMSFYKDILNIKTNYKTFHVNLDVNLLNAILSHEPFFIARLGAIYKINTLRDIYVNALTRLNEPSPLTYICDMLQQKWKHRYNVKDVEIMTTSNILKTFIKYQLTNIQGDEQYDMIWKNITGYCPDTLQGKHLQTLDYEFMNKYEIIQYNLHKDNRFLLQLATFGIILKENNDITNSDIMTICKSVGQHSKKHVMVLSVDTETIEDYRFSYKLDRDFLFLIPKISTKFFLISNENRVSTKILCTIPSECLLISNNVLNVTPEQRSHFAFLLTQDPKMVSPNDSVYHFPAFSTSTKAFKFIKEVQLYIWREYHNLKCPFQTQNSRQSGMLFVNFVSLYLMKHTENILETLRTYKLTDKNEIVSIVCVDNRFNVMSLLSVLVSLYNVIKHEQIQSYNGIICTSHQAIDQYRSLIESLSLHHLITVKEVKGLNDIDLFHMELYNKVMKSVSFWNDLKCDKCIIVQDDGWLMNGKFIDDYLNYDYVGAPWTDVKDNDYIKKYINSQLVGNGGFSIRNVEKMKHICQTYEIEKKDLFYHNLNEIPEDVYFVKHLVKMGANVAPFDIARKFAIEQVMCVGAVGFHKFWMYNLPTETVKVFNSFLD